MLYARLHALEANQNVLKCVKHRENKQQTDRSFVQQTGATKWTRFEIKETLLWWCYLRNNVSLFHIARELYNIVLQKNNKQPNININTPRPIHARRSIFYPSIHLSIHPSIHQSTHPIPLRVTEKAFTHLDR